MMSKLVSIIIPIYNSEEYIERTILSCINQTYSNIELILVNDGSTDKTEEIILSIPDNRIKYYKIVNSGACNARNFAISIAQGDLIQFLDHDDILERNKLFYQIEKFMDKGDDYIYSGTMGTVSGMNESLDKGYDLYERDFSPKEYFETTLNQFGKYITTGAWLVPVKLVKSTHGWDGNAGLNDDGEYFMRIIINSSGVIFCKKSVFYFRRDVPNSLSKQFNSKEVYKKWLFSYISYVDNFQKKFEPPIARKLSRLALSVYYCNSYPDHPDLLKQCKTKIKSLGFKHPSPHGGKSFFLTAKVIGVDNALRLWNLKNKVTSKNKLKN